jgi:hypothetical protein
MDKKDKSQNDNCSIFQERIFELFNDGISVNRDLSENNHINNCLKCQNYLENLHILKNHMQKSPSKELKPNPRIIKNIIAHKNIKKDFRKIRPNSIWGSIRTIFEYRIPVYQALSGAVVALMLFMYISSNLISPDNRATNIEYSGNQNDITSSELYVLDTLNLTKPERGQNAKEDSVLISFLVPTM